MAQDDVGRRLRTDKVEDDDTVDPYESHVVDEERDAQRGDVLDDEIIDPYEGDGSDEDDNDNDDTGDVEKKEYDKKKTDMDDKEEDQETRDVGKIDYDERNTSLKWYISHGFHLVQGKMNHGMEDYIVVKNRKLHGFQLGRDPESAVKRAYEVTDDDILENVAGSRGGSTAVTEILIDGKKLVVANVGDSRAVLNRNGKAEQITVDHEPEKEKSLVESRGGFVLEKPGNIPCLDGQLAMTWAFGDGKLKDDIMAEPVVVVETINNDTWFIILASVGLWKIMSNQEACDCIGEVKNAQDASEQLIKEAQRRKSLDDISCIVVMFH
ncbi:hypothetical protein LguiB_004671 [Lonicera macranthoides]